jgi:hypothetical protein
VERHGQPAWRIECDDLAVGGDAAVGIRVPERRSDRPLGFDARAVVVLRGLLAVGDRAPDPLRIGLDVDAVHVVRRGHSGTLLQVLLQRAQGSDYGRRELADPAIVDQADRHGVEVVPLLATDLPRRDQVRRLEDVQVTHDAEPGHPRELVRKLAECLAVEREQPVEQQSPARVAQRLEHLRHRIHGLDYM